MDNSPEAKTYLDQFTVIGIIGGIGSGKSALSRWLSDQLSVVRIDGDELGHQVLKDHEVIELLSDRFGKEILDASGNIDRKQLGARIWKNEHSDPNALTDLEAIVHPKIRQRMTAQIEQAKANGKMGVIVDAAVMLESGWSNICDRIYFISRPDADREAAVKLRGWTSDEWRLRELSQWSLERKQEASDKIIENNTTIDAAGREILKDLEQQFQWSPRIKQNDS